MPWQFIQKNPGSLLLETQLNYGIQTPNLFFGFFLLHIKFLNGSNCNFSFFRLQKWNGHTSTVQQMKFCPKNAYFVSFAAEDRFIDIWDFQHPSAENAVAGWPSS